MSKDGVKDKVMSPYLFIMHDVIFTRRDPAVAQQLIETHVPMDRVDEVTLELAEHMRTLLTDIPEIWQMYILPAALTFMYNDMEGK